MCDEASDVYIVLYIVQTEQNPEDCYQQTTGFYRALQTSML